MLTCRFDQDWFFASNIQKIALGQELTIQNWLDADFQISFHFTLLIHHRHFMYQGLIVQQIA